MSKWHGGKGSRRRNPNEKKYQENWDKIFNNKQNKKEKENESTKHKRVL
jgi:hypothetical protein